MDLIYLTLCFWMDADDADARHKRARPRRHSASSSFNHFLATFLSHKLLGLSSSQGIKNEEKKEEEE
jgi:hypothetical protein